MKKQAVAYCRVSTDSKDQKNSFQSQQRYFKNLFKGRDDIVLQKIYADRGLSGTKLYRPQLDALLQNAGLERIVDKDTNTPVDTYKIVCKSQFDYIYVSNVSRFARNISADNLIKTLAQNNVFLVYVDFEGNVYSTENEVGQKFIIDELVHAERFSRDLSAKVKFGMKQGAINGNIYCGRNLYGYTYVKRNIDEPEKGNYLIINEDEAEVIKLIFDLYLNEKMGTERISRYLAEHGIFTRTGKRFASNTILSIIKNEKYCGINNALHIDTGSIFGSKKIQFVDYNNPIRQQAREATNELKENGVERIPPIVSEDTWEKAQSILMSKKSHQNNKGRYTGKTDYAGLIICGKCGGAYTSAGTKKDKDGNIKKRYYVCQHRYRFDTENGVEQCFNHSISEQKLDEVLNSNGYTARWWIRVKDLLNKAKACKKELYNNIDKDNEVLITSLKEQLKTNTEEKDRLLNLYMKGKCTEKQYDKFLQPLNDTETQLNAQIKSLSRNNKELYNAIAELDKIIEKYQKENDKLQKEFNNLEVRNKFTRKELLQDIDKIVIDEEGEPHLYFKSLQLIENKIENLLNGDV